jgi:hypothetical protein
MEDTGNPYIVRALLDFDEERKNFKYMKKYKTPRNSSRPSNNTINPAALL